MRGRENKGKRKVGKVAEASLPEYTVYFASQSFSTTPTPRKGASPLRHPGEELKLQQEALKLAFRKNFPEE
jgi:hypothetical protein